MNVRRFLCVTSLVLMMFLVGCGEKKLDMAALDYDWQFVEAEGSGEVIPHTPGLEAKEPAVKFDGNDVEFSLNGNAHMGKVEAGEENYSITYPDNSGNPMVAVLSDDGNTLTISIESLNLHFRFTKE